MRSNFLLWTCVTLLWIESSSSKARRKEQSEWKKSHPCQCGKSPLKKYPASEESSDSNLRIVNGDVVKPVFKYPWMIAILKNGTQNCGGAIISPHYVLSAAHCFVQKKEDASTSDSKCYKFSDGNDYCVLKLEHFRMKHVRKSRHLSSPVKIKFIKVFRDFTLPDHNYDIALLRAETRLPCTKYTAPICLPKSDEPDGFDTNVTIAGWGETKMAITGDKSKLILREATLKLRRNKYCKVNDVSEEMHFCALGNNQNTCYGDSGGPIFKDSSDIYTVVGVSSYGTGEDCDSSSSEYFTKVKSFQPWITRNIKKMTKNSKRQMKEEGTLLIQ